MMFAALREYHLMIGMDVHMPVIPPGIFPYFVANNMNNTLNIHLTTLYTPDVYADAWQRKMCKGSDIGMLIPHLGVMSWVIVLEILLSGSKCHFGPSNVFVADQHGGTQNPAAAVLVYANVNLNCGFPIPTYTNIVIAPNTATLSMTIGDIAAGLYSMSLDFMFQVTINAIAFFVIGPLCRWVSKRVVAWMGIRGFSRAAAREAARPAWRAARNAFKREARMSGIWVNMKKAGPSLSQIVGEITPPRAYWNPEPFINALNVVIENPINFFVNSPIGTAADAPAIGLPSAYEWVRSQIEEKWPLPSEDDVRESWDSLMPQENNPAEALESYYNDGCIEEFGEGP